MEPASIITAWDWRPPPSGIDDSRIIDKIRIVHSRNDPPQSKYPLNPDNVIELDSNSSWQYGWNGLKVDREHYFALYAHEKGGVWLAPKHVNQHLSNNGHEDRWNIPVERLYIDTTLPTNIVGTAAINIFGPIPGGNIGFLVFNELNNGEYGAVLDARIQGFGLTTGGTIDIVPVRWRIDSGMTWDNISNSILYDYEHSMTTTLTGGEIVDIKDQINAARLHGSNTIALIPPTGSAININDISSLTFWDPGLAMDLFSVWRNN